MLYHISSTRYAAFIFVNLFKNENTLDTKEMNELITMEMTIASINFSEDKKETS